MARIRSGWTPPNTDNSNNEHVLGFDFSSDVTITANGVWWWQDGGAQPTTVRAMLWLTSTQALVADSGTVSTAGFTSAAWNFVPFTSGFGCSPSTTYTPAIYCTGSYKYSSTDLGSDIVDPTGHVTALAHTGRFLNTAGANFPTSTWDGMFGTDLDFTVGSTGTTPTGIAVSVGLGSPSTALLGADPTGIAVPVALGLLGGRSVIVRPNTGIVTRPYTGTITRP